MSAFFFIQWPFEGTDTDMWYHMNGGRYFFENHEISNTSFFSFLSPQRERTNYYWLFQVLIFKIYSYAGYHGLIFFRSAVFLAIVYLIFRFLLKDQSSKLLLFIFMFYPLLLFQRCMLARPHIISFLFITLFLYIIEFHPRKIKYLPFLGVLWMNIHGIEYPVLIIITLSYIIDFFFRRIKLQTPSNRTERTYILSLVISMATIFITPHFVKLLT